MEPSPSYPRVTYHQTGREPLSTPTNHQPPPKVRDRYWLHLLLFVATLLSTAFTGAQFAGRTLAWTDSNLLFSLFGMPITLEFVWDGLRFAVSLLLFLTVHEFGHYFAARYHRVSTSLPYYIPSPFIGIGTLGAVIRIREPIPSLRKLFDIGAAGPIAGFVVALGVLIYALATLQSPEYIMDLDGHEALKAYIQQHGTFPPAMLPDPALEGFRLTVGQTPLYWFLAQFFPNVPPMYEMYHYPILFAGWLGLFFTALNLLPVGQLDGGHILYALVGPKWHTRLARSFVVLLLISVAIGFIEDGAGAIITLVPYLAPYQGFLDQASWFILAALLYPLLSRVYKGDHRLIAPTLLGIVLIAVLAKFVGDPLMQFGYLGWLVWALLLVFFIRVDHPPVLYAQPLTSGRRILAIVSIIIFLLCFSIKPLYFV